MKSILEHLFQGDIIFPLEPGDERRFGDLGDKVQTQKEQLEKLLEGETLRQMEDYLEQLEQYHDWKRCLAYENGFLLAVVLCMEISDRLERLKL